MTPSAALVSSAVAALAMLSPYPGIAQDPQREPKPSPEAPARPLPDAKPREEARPVPAQGIWQDPDTGLQWTAKDNGSAISGEQASRYCQALVLAGFDDWRQPTIEELEGIYNSSMPPGAPKIKPPLQLSSGGWWVWSGTRGSAYSSPSAWSLYFIEGSRDENHLDGVVAHYRAVCVRGSGG